MVALAEADGKKSFESEMAALDDGRVVLYI